MNEAAAFAIRVRDVWKSYPRRPVLQGITGDFPAGRVVVLVGPNGAGKTTFMRIIAGLQFADRGSVEARDSVYFGGFDTLPLKGRAQDLRRALGIPQEGRFADRRLPKLSRGELQWVGVEAALALDRSVTLLDEPWTALEPDVRENLNTRLRERASEGRCIVCSTHELDEAIRVADDILFLREGRALWMAREQAAGGRFDRDAILGLFRGQENP